MSAEGPDKPDGSFSFAFFGLGSELSSSLPKKNSFVSKYNLALFLVASETKRNRLKKFVVLPNQFETVLNRLKQFAFILKLFEPVSNR